MLIKQKMHHHFTIQLASRKSLITLTSVNKVHSHIMNVWNRKMTKNVENNMMLKMITIAINKDNLST